MLFRRFALGYHGSTANYNCDIKEVSHMESGIRKISFICCHFGNDGAIMLPGTFCCCPLKMEIKSLLLWKGRYSNAKSYVLSTRRYWGNNCRSVIVLIKQKFKKPEVVCIYGICLGSSTKYWETFAIWLYRLKCSDMFGKSSDYYLHSGDLWLRFFSRRLNVFH